MDYRTVASNASFIMLPRLCTGASILEVFDFSPSQRDSSLDKLKRGKINNGYK